MASEPTTPGPDERPPAAPGEPGGAGRLDRARRGGRTAELYAAAILGLVIVGLLIAWVVANREQVRVDWLVGSTQAALALVIFVAAALGWLLGIATSFAIRRRVRHRREGRG
ncbi:LapA family protein [Miltoncostaea marina]|uniref:LapA family protein n=1 Tax=Miltoncostaea marina TaxID=2843215 RepID=UPI001C3DDBC7|nr:LapA family protein [Miltoncostaea marina]